MYVCVFGYACSRPCAGVWRPELDIALNCPLVSWVHWTKNLTLASPASWLAPGVLSSAFWVLGFQAATKCGFYMAAGIWIWVSMLVWQVLHPQHNQWSMHCDTYSSPVCLLRASLPIRELLCRCADVCAAVFLSCVFGLKISLSLILCSELMLFFTVCSSCPIPVHEKMCHLGAQQP